MITFRDDLYLKICAGYPILAVNTPEEDRVMAEIRQAGWWMAQGHEVYLGYDYDYMLELFRDYPHFACAVKDRVVTFDVDRLVGLCRQLKAEEKEAEENKVVEYMDHVGYPTVVFDRMDGFSNKGGNLEVSAAILAVALYGDAAKNILNVPLPDDCLVVFKDIHEHLNAPNTDGSRWRRALRYIFAENRLINQHIRRPVVLLQPDWRPHHDVAECIHFVNFAPPNKGQLDAEITVVQGDLKIKSADAVAKCPPELRPHIISAVRGMTQNEVHHALSYSLVLGRGFRPEILPILHRLKAETLQRDEVLEYIAAEHCALASDIGGYENWKEYVELCKECYTEEAQDAGLKRPKGALLLGVPGCVADDTIVAYNRGNRTSTRTLPINMFHDKFNNVGDRHPGAQWKGGLNTYLHSFNADTGQLFFNRVRGVYAKGKKRCLRITTDVAGSVTLTYDHPVLRADAIFAAAGEICLGDQLLVRGSMLPRRGDSPPAVRRPRVAVEALKYHPIGWPHYVTDSTSGKTYTYQRTHRARLVVEAHMNRLSYDELVRILKEEPDRAETLTYLDAEMEVHHLNEDPSDDRLENLMVLTKADHTRHHCDETRFNVEYTRKATVVRVEDMGMRETYDVSMADPCANFVVNDGIVVHNTGKSVMAMATAKMMNLPLIKYDFGSVFGGIVGQTESTQRRALVRVKAMGPCVLFIDEADKAFSGMQQTVGDSGVGQRVFGRLLSWMALENTDAFVIMTMNRLDGVPPEMLRAGRLDAVYYTTFPDPIERKEILQIHMRKNGADPSLYKDREWEALASSTEDFVGAELEHIVIRAVRASWKDRKTLQPTLAELDKARSLVNPVAKLDAETVKQIMDKCQGRATPVSKPKKSGGPGRRSVVIDHPGSN